MDRKPGTAPMALALFVTIVGVVLAISSKRSDAEFWRTLESEIFSVMYRLSAYILPTLLVLALVYPSARNRKIVPIAAVLMGIHAIATVYRSFVPRPLDPVARGTIDTVIDGYQLLTEGYLMIPAITLLTLRFQGRLDRVRFAGLIATATFALVLLASFWSSGSLYHFVEDVAAAGYLAVIMASVWCAAFRRDDVGRGSPPPLVDQGSSPQ